MSRSFFGARTIVTASFVVSVALASISLPPTRTVSADGPIPDSVVIVDNAFWPGTLTVTPGTTVSWSNSGRSSHTTTSTSAGWDSGSLSSGGTFSVRFATPGAFEYYCRVHSEMTGVIVVVGRPPFTYGYPQYAPASPYATPYGTYPFAWAPWGYSPYWYSPYLPDSHSPRWY